MTTKILLFGIVAGVVWLTGVTSGVGWLIPFAAVFVVVGFSQLAMVVKQAVVRLEKVDAERSESAARSG